MVQFNTKRKFKILENGLICASAGTQTNCGGIAAILVRLEKTKSKELVFAVSQDGDWDGNASHVPGSKLCKTFRDAIFDGAKQATIELKLEHGFKLTLVEALVHPMDARESKFREAGFRAVTGWLKQESQNT